MLVAHGNEHLNSHILVFKKFFYKIFMAEIY